MSARRKKCCGDKGARDYLAPILRGCSSVVEHLLAKEDVASSSLVTRSSFERCVSGCASN
jgi:hypothetical protein